MKRQFVLIPTMFIFVIFSVFTSSAQKPQIDQVQQTKFLEQKAKHYQQLYSIEQEITANQQDYDVTYYSLHLTPDPATSILSGQVEVVAEVLGATLDQMELNFWDGMTITDIHRPDSPDLQLSYTRSQDLLMITLDSTYTQGEQMRVVIAYNGQPQNSIYNSFRFNSYAGEDLMWSFSQPYGARAWWPCKDVTSDKADSVDIRVTIPNEFIVASNGTLRETTIDGDLTTYWWHEQYPIVTYLVSVAIYPYEVHYDDYLYNDGADTMKIHFYTFPGNYDLYSEINAQVNDMIWVFSQIYGEYPFIEEKYGHADCLLGGAMEHQTCTSFGLWFDWLYVHELAHQWWGDLVTCDSFHHIWLNEGLASYSEAIWFEVVYQYPASEYLLSNRHYLGPGTVYVEDPENEPIFDGNLSYNKAAWVIHMLRHVVGDSVTGDILLTYASAPEHRYGTATTEEFQALCEEVSGMDLQKFFQQWIYEEYYPQYGYGWNMKPEESGYQINLGIEQIQENTVLFWMPIDVRITTSSYDTLIVVWDSLQYQAFEFFVDEEPINVEIDPYNWILKETEVMLLAPYADNVTLNRSYQTPGTGTLIITSETVNPDNHNVDLEAIVESFDQLISETIPMYDDGFHNDGEAEDGIFGASWPVPTGERRYNVDIKTTSLESGYSSVFQNSAFFTTIGPVVYDGNFDNRLRIGVFSQKFLFKIRLQNIGQDSTAENLMVRVNLVSEDSCFTMGDDYRGHGDILPGEIVDGQQYFSVNVDTSCLEGGSLYLPLSIEVESDGYVFWTDTFSIDILSDIVDEESTLPKKFALDQNYPNPFNPTTLINYQLPITNYVEISIYNLLGQRVASLVNEQQRAGSYQVEWDASNFSSGIYYYQIKAGEFQAVRKMILLR